MKFLRIGVTKLKVVLTKEERERFLLDRDVAECDKSRVKCALSEILTEAKAKGDFDIGQDKVLVQLYPDEGGGCEIFITKLANLSEKEQRDVLRADNITSCERVSSVFKFASFKDLLRAARAVRSDGIESDLYYSGDAYYIKAVENTLDGVSALLPLYEFGERISELPTYAIYEQGRVIMKGDGLKKLSAL